MQQKITQIPKIVISPTDTGTIQEKKNDFAKGSSADPVFQVNPEPGF
jgi:hypothetical protein